MTWLERAMAVTPLASQTRSKGPAAYGIGCAPHVATAADGSKIWCGRQKYIDWVCGLGAISLSYAHPNVDAAIYRQLSDGIISASLPTHLEAEVAEKLRAIIPCTQPDGMARFVKTGSEACEAAVRIARKATGRDIILVPKSGYHGWHSWAQAWKDQCPGVPSVHKWIVKPFDYNDPYSLEEAYLGAMSREYIPPTAGHVNGVAAVLMEPTLFEAPKPGFLEGVRQFCSDRGIVLIFDEMVTGFRLARAGGQERFGIVPDLACYGKGLANGMPLAVVCGKKELMAHADVVSGTFGGEALSLAAARAVLDVYAQQDVCTHMAQIGFQLQSRIGHLSVVDRIRQHCPTFAATDWPQVWKFIGLDNRSLGLLTQEMAKRSVLWHPRITYVSLAHTVQDVDQTVAAMDESLRVVACALESGDWSALTGQPPDEPFARKT